MIGVKPSALACSARRARGVQRDDDINAAIAQVQRVRVALGAVADDGDALGPDQATHLRRVRRGRAWDFLVLLASLAPAPHIGKEETRDGDVQARSSGSGAMRDRKPGS